MSQSASSGIAPDLFLADVDSPEAAPASGFPIAAIGASAGGLAALSKLLESIPADSGIGFVVITHLDPSRESHMPELLARRTAMEISQATEAQPIQPNHIYVIPPGNTMTIERGILHLQPQRARAHNAKPIDLFMTHLARDQKAGSIAIVLTGVDADGTIGVKQIKAEGGMVMVQDPYSAEYADMPRNAAATGLADFVLPVEQMGQALLTYVRTAGLHDDAGPQIPPIESEDIAGLLLALHRGGEPDFREYKPGMILRRIRRRMGITGIKTLAEFRKHIEESADGRRVLATDFLVGVTEFFREPRGWAVLGESILPRLFQQKNGDKPLRVWIPACASGQEAYSMAMLLSEHAEQSKQRTRIEIFATDIDRHALDRARAGIYPGSVAHTLQPERLRKFFVEIDGAYQVRKELRSLILFSNHNLLRDPPFSRMDIVSCRNLLIYLQPAMQRHAASLFSFSLDEGGYLLLGRSEGIADPQGAFEEVVPDARIYRRKPGMRPRTLKFQVTDFAGDTVGVGDGIAARGESTAQLVQKTLLARCTPAAALVDRSFQVLYFHGNVDPFLRRATGAPSNNILDMARDGLGIKIRTLIQQATEENRMASALAQVTRGDQSVRVGITVLPVSESSRAGPLYLVTFSQLANAISGDGGAADKPATAEGQEFAEARHEVQSMIQDLRETNEELMSANEELQSANEELASSKEEMQSLNEEMNAVNAQLEMKVGELEATTDDLNNFLRNARIACLFLDRNMKIKRYTAPMTQLFRLLPSDVGRPIAHFSSAFLDQRLIADAQEVLASLGSNESQLRTHDGKWYWRYIQPYETADNHVEGVVVTYLDIASLKQAEENMRRLATILQDSNDAIMVHDFDGHVLVWNHSAERMYGYSAAEMQAINVSTLVPASQKDQFTAMIAKARRGEAMTPLETQRVARDGRILDVGVTVSLLRDEQGQASGVSTTERDISERLRAQEQLQYRALRLQEADRRRTEFLAMLGHELRNPLAPVRNVLHLMRQGAMSADQLSWATGLMERQTAHLSRLIDDLLDVSRITSGKVHLQRGRVEVRSVIDHALEATNPLLQERNHRLKVKISDEPMSVFGDAARLQQVVGNLLTNAFKYTRRGGDIRIEAGESDDEIIIRVSDNGMGIKADLLPHIFDLFVQGDQTIDRSQGGLGIGLTLVRQLVEMHGGHVDAKSEGVDKGAEFVIHLPRMPEQRSSDRQAREPDRGADAVQRKILIVDDNEDFASSLQMLLQAERHEVQTAHDGMAAIEIAHAFKPDIVLLDLGLPGVNGYETAERLRAIPELHDVMLIAVSGYAQEEDRQRSKKAGFNSHLKKPVDIQQVLAAIQP
jgi:two-component system CheB/CheR fusion protein